MKIALILAALTLALTALSARAGDAGKGRDLAGQCRTCHGLDGIAKQPLVPNLAGDDANYLTEQLRAFRAGTRQNEVMSVVAGGLSDEQIADLAAWYATIKVSAQIPQ